MKPLLSKKWALIGMPGSGKSTLLKNLAKSENYLCKDLDVELERQEKMSISALWNFYGESYFRTAERQSLLGTLSKPMDILACGGGTVAFLDNFHVLRSLVTIIYIEVPITTLSFRLVQNSYRPMFQSQSPLEIELKLNKIYGQRKRFFELADFTIQADEDEHILSKRVKNILEN